MSPHSAEVRTVAAGCWWDAVRVPAAPGVRALALLGERTGAVIRDGYGGILYWLVPPGEANDWHLPEVQVLGRGSHVAVPPSLRTKGPGLYWQVPPAYGRECTDTARLHAALSTALSVQPAP
ncbi:hypothetical protein [Streptomyces sp. NPDC046862]|uniref:hypothetical protein n=1 Tax=Streptomyces sp. NPDC046862 TaxID=3154603 RepID=UPI003451D351